MGSSRVGSNPTRSVILREVIFIPSKNHFLSFALNWAAMAEWLRRLTRNQMGSSRVGSNPTRSVWMILKTNHHNELKKVALSGNRTPVSRVAGENSTTEPTMHGMSVGSILSSSKIIFPKENLHCRGIEPRSPAWQARILPLNQQCLPSFILHSRVRASKWRPCVNAMLHKTDHDGDRTHNLPIRSRTPYPLGHAADACLSKFEVIIYDNMKHC